MLNKTISINPSLFRMGGSKTKKKDKQQKTTVIPLISPNVLKNKLLKRIKEHKQRETENLENNKRILPNKENIHNFSESNTENIKNYTDEFKDSLSYLQTLSKQKKVNDEKNNYEKQKLKKKEELERKTVRNYSSLSIPTTSQQINIDLPEELQQPLITINTEQFNNSLVKSHNPEVPYGILKGGLKPTYKDWTKTQRNNIVTNPNDALTIGGTQLNKEKTEREKRLYDLREKLKLKQQEEAFKTNENIMLTQNLIQKPVQDNGLQNLVVNNLNFNQDAFSVANGITSGITNGITSEITNNIANINLEDNGFQNVNGLDGLDKLNDLNTNMNGEIIAIKKITKKTIKRKYTLGRSKIKNKIGILIKDRGTRKQVLNAQKDLKRKSINDIKTYLRAHNMIQSGSNAPNDVLRKLYESSMLAGEITNTNIESLLQNLSKDEKEL
jgi:hypothetical protein